MAGVLGIVLSLLLLMVLAYRGVSVLVLAPLLALLAALFGGETPLLAVYTQVFMVALGGFVAKYFPLFLLGALFGKLMEDSGAARTIALKFSRMLGPRHAMTAIVLACAVLTYGGVSLFVVVFVAYPLAAELFRASDVPQRFIPASIALGSFTFSMSCLPGSVQIQNLIPMTYFGTTPFAAPALGLIGGALMLGGGLLWLRFRARGASQRQEGYGASPFVAVPNPARSTGLGESYSKDHNASDPGFAVALTPLVAVVVLNFVFAEVLLPRMDHAYLAEARYGSTAFENVRGVWATIAAMATSVALLMTLQYRRLASLNQTLGKGAAGCMLPIFNTASEVGYGATIASLPAFAIVKHWVLNLAPNQPLVSEALAINVLAGVTGSASGGLSIALEALGEFYRDRAEQLDISLEAMHRIATMSAGGFDTLPHNGAVITLLAICGLTHRQSYFDIAMVSLVIPVASTAVVIALGMFTGLAFSAT